MGIVLDQGLSAITNFAATALAARGLSVVEFGLFAIAQAGALFAIGLVRAGLAESAVVTSAEINVRDARHAFGIAVISMLATVAFTPFVGSAAVVLATGLLAVTCLGEMLRTWQLSAGAVSRSITFDVMWLVASVTAIAVIAPESVGGFLNLWLGAGAGATVACMALFRQRLGRPTTRRGRLALAFGGEHVAGAGMQPLMMALLGALFGATSAGLARLLMLAFAPVNLLFTAARPVVIDPRRHSVGPLPVSATFSAVVLAWWLVTASVGDGALQWLLGEQWRAARDHLTPWALFALGSAMAAGPGLSLRRRGRGRRLLLVRVVASLPIPLGLVITWFVVSSSTEAAFWSLAAAGAIGACVWLSFGAPPNPKREVTA